MANTDIISAWPAFSWGVIAGMRSMSAPALASHFLSRSFSPALAGSPLRFLQSAKVATGLKVLAATEIIGDKLPGAPNRIAAPVLSFRILSGALVGAGYSQQNKQSKWVGALLGGAGAIAGSYAFYFLRTRLVKNTAVPDWVYALLEDTMMLTSGIRLANATLKK
ncbi:DUF4126 family protein [Adhaeribacter pallidiroseus]|uniref:DUF4126 domain-containing protein n=1 Tax=Adhaeribacter pallidiroseus TaxID=2072847 RepID=A0A369QB68_9BACT|nr:DUF4126 family protein [Adhaeribacter pallidiroseus]RDC62161.1 hypothetical protein AHMF7616_00752 [Adhaeribacter pallidiroseus]